MKFFLMFLLFTVSVSVVPNWSLAQLKIQADNGILQIDDGSLFFNPEKYKHMADSLSRLVSSGKHSTTDLFDLALLYDLSNNQMAKPVPGDKIALANLLRADSLIERAARLGIYDIKLKILHAQVYRDLTYRFAGDERWKFSTKEISRRRSAFNKYKDLANQTYNSLALEDPSAAADYHRLAVKVNYPISN